MATATAAEPSAPAKKKSKSKLIVAVLAIVAVAGAAYFFLGSKSSAATVPQPGEVVKLDPINLNLAGGHYLKLGLALQVVKGAKAVPEGSEALDLAISLFSNRQVTELANNVTREKAKAALVEEVRKAYHGDVMDIYFTEFVTQ
jgi:flagellar protein FliL